AARAARRPRRRSPRGGRPGRAARLLSAYRAVGAAQRRPAAAQRLVRPGVLARLRLVDLDTPAGPVVRPHVAVAYLRAADEDLPAGLVEAAAFLYPEIVAGPVQGQAGRPPA